MLVLPSLLLLAVASVDAQCTGNFSHFFEFGVAAGDTVVDGTVTLDPPPTLIPMLGTIPIEIRVSKLINN